MKERKRADMADLLGSVIAAHGGLDRWCTVRAIDLTFDFSGGLLDIKGYPGHHRPSASIDAATPRTVFQRLPVRPSGIARTRRGSSRRSCGFPTHRVIAYSIKRLASPSIPTTNRSDRVMLVDHWEWSRTKGRRPNPRAVGPCSAIVFLCSSSTSRVEAVWPVRGPGSAHNKQMRGFNG
jgi:hypothetical protein